MLNTPEEKCQYDSTGLECIPDPIYKRELYDTYVLQMTNFRRFQSDIFKQNPVKKESKITYHTFPITPKYLI